MALDSVDVDTSPNISSHQDSMKVSESHRMVDNSSSTDESRNPSTPTPCSLCGISPMKIADPQSLVRERRVRIRIPAEPAPDLRIRIIRQDRIVSGRRVSPTQAPRPVSTTPTPSLPQGQTHVHMILCWKAQRSPRTSLGTSQSQLM